MRTTVELPPDLMKQAKSRAAARGESLKSLLTRAVASELGKTSRHRESEAHVRLPLFGHPKGKSVSVSQKDISDALAQDDVTVASRAMRLKKK